MFRLWRKSTERKSGARPAAVTTSLHEALQSNRSLTPEEERVLRMRHGVALADLSSPLARAVESEGELQDELALLELQLFRAQRARQAGPHGRAAPEHVSVSRTTRAVAGRTKEKIVRALRKKK